MSFLTQSHQVFLLSHILVECSDFNDILNILLLPLRDVDKDWTCEEKDKDQAYKDQDKDKDLNLVLKVSLWTRTSLTVTYCELH